MSSWLFSFNIFSVTAKSFRPVRPVAEPVLPLSYLRGKIAERMDFKSWSLDIPVIYFTRRVISGIGANIIFQMDFLASTRVYCPDIPLTDSPVIRAVTLSFLLARRPLHSSFRQRREYAESTEISFSFTETLLNNTVETTKDSDRDVQINNFLSII